MWPVRVSVEISKTPRHSCRLASKMELHVRRTIMGPIAAKCSDVSHRSEAEQKESLVLRTMTAWPAWKDVLALTCGECWANKFP